MLASLADDANPRKPVRCAYRAGTAHAPTSTRAATTSPSAARSPLALTRALAPAVAIVAEETGGRHAAEMPRQPVAAARGASCRAAGHRRLCEAVDGEAVTAAVALDVMLLLRCRIVVVVRRRNMLMSVVRSQLARGSHKGATAVCGRCRLSPIPTAPPHSNPCRRAGQVPAACNPDGGVWLRLHDRPERRRTQRLRVRQPLRSLVATLPARRGS